VSRPDRSGADQIDAEHRATNPAIRPVGPIRTRGSCSGAVDRLGLRLVARNLQEAGAWHERRRRPGVPLHRDQPSLHGGHHTAARAGSDLLRLTSTRSPTSTIPTSSAVENSGPSRLLSSPTDLNRSCELSREGSGHSMSFCLSFDHASLGPTGAHWLDGPSDLSCKERTCQHAVDGWPLSCKQQALCLGRELSGREPRATRWPRRHRKAAGRQDERWTRCVGPADGEDRPLKVGKPSVLAAAVGRALWAWLLSGPAAWSAGTGRSGPGWPWRRPARPAPPRRSPRR
jgi:hypothetical protein